MGGKIPPVDGSTVDSLPLNHLVRYRGVVRDVRSPEFYASRMESVIDTEHSIFHTKYRDEVDLDQTRDYREVEYCDRYVRRRVLTY